MLFIILKIVHFFALFSGGAGAIGNGLLMKKVIDGGGPPPPMVAETMRTIGRIGFVSIVLLWATGIWMALIEYGSLAIGWAFYVKLLGAAAVLIPVSLMTKIAIDAERAQTPPDLGRMKSLSQVARAGLAVAIIFAVIAFNG